MCQELNRLDPETAENTGRIELHIKNRLQREVQLSGDITAIMIEHLENTKINCRTYRLNMYKQQLPRHPCNYQIRQLMPAS